MEEWKDFLGRNVKLIFEDGDNHFSKKEGVVLDITPTHLILNSGKIEAILLIKILRVELK